MEKVEPKGKTKFTPILITREQKDSLEIGWHAYVAKTRKNITFKEFVIVAINAFKG